MGQGPLRCPHCGQTDFFVVSTGVSYRGGTIVERYHWPESEDPFELADAYHVDQEILVEPELHDIEGPVRALCAQCLADRTDQFLERDRTRSLPV